MEKVITKTTFESLSKGSPAEKIKLALTALKKLQKVKGKDEALALGKGRYSYGQGDTIEGIYTVDTVDFPSVYRAMAEDERFDVWIAGYKQTRINSKARLTLAVDLGLGEESRADKAKRSVIEDTILRLVSTGKFTREQAEVLVLGK